MPSSGQTLTCLVKAVFGITSLRLICMSDILAMVWYMWFKNHIENIDLKSHHQALGSIQELRQSVFHNFGPLSQLSCQRCQLRLRPPIPP